MSGKKPVPACAVRGNGPGGRGVHDDTVRRLVCHHRKAAAPAPAPAEGIVPTGVKDHHIEMVPRSVQVFQHRTHRDGTEPQGGLIQNIGVYGYQVVLAAGLHPVACIKKEAVGVP